MIRQAGLEDDLLVCLEMYSTEVCLEHITVIGASSSQKREKSDHMEGRVVGCRIKKIAASCSRRQRFRLNSLDHHFLH